MRTLYYANELYHHGIKGQHWGVRRFQEEDGSLTSAGEQRYSNPVKNKKSVRNSMGYKMARGMTKVNDRFKRETGQLRSTQRKIKEFQEKDRAEKEKLGIKPQSKAKSAAKIGGALAIGVIGAIGLHYAKQATGKAIGQALVNKMID